MPSPNADRTGRSIASSTATGGHRRTTAYSPRSLGAKSCAHIFGQWHEDRLQDHPPVAERYPRRLAPTSSVCRGTGRIHRHRVSETPSGILALAQSYQPVADGDYVRDATVGAMMGPGAIRSAMQWALTQRVGIFHVHSHEGIGLPWFQLNRSARTDQVHAELSECCGPLPARRTRPKQHGCARARVAYTRRHASACRRIHRGGRTFYANGAVYEPAGTSELSWSGKPGSSRPGDGRPRWAGRRWVARQSAMRAPWSRRLRAG